MSANPKGRVDVLALALAERLTHERLEPRIGNVPVWDALKPIVQEGIKAGMKAAGVYYSQLIIWVKNNIVLGRKDYNPQHELIAYGWFGAHKFERGKAKSVLFCPKPTKAKLHPTMKPVELLRKLIANSTNTGDWVYDPFLGSGSTLIACEHLQRRCIGIELDEQYVETAKARWEKLTSKKAEKIEINNV